jgi:hypothetical protein
MITSTIVFVHGKDTCASETKNFCRFFATNRFGTIPVCMLYNDVELYEEGGWVQRCDQCKAEFDSK